MPGYDMNSQAAEALLEEHLRSVYDLTEAGDYEGALADLEKALDSAPSNIYILALERQVKTLMEFLDAQELGEDRRMELIEPMPGLIECAVRELKKPSRTPERDLSQTGNGESEREHGDVPETEELREAEEIDEAGVDGGNRDIESVKLLYFQQAGAFVAKGEYERALVEVRRVLEIDPDNAIAHEYVARVEQILTQPRRSTLFYVQPPEESPAPPATGEDRTPESPQHARSTVEETGRDPRRVAPATGGWSPANDDRTVSGRMQSSETPHPVPGKRVPDKVRDEHTVTRFYQQSPALRQESGTHEPRRFSRRMIVVTVVMCAVVLAGGAYAAFLATRGSSTAAESRVIKTAPPEDPQISAVAPVAGREENSQVSLHNAPVETPAVSSSAVEKPAPEAARSSAPPAATPREATAPPSLPAAKMGPARNPVQKPGQGAEKTEVQKPVQTPRSQTVNLQSHVLAVNTPETKPAGSAVPSTETATAPVPAYVPTQIEPQVVKLERPEIPDFIWMPGVVEKVVIRVLIDVDGKPVDTQILMSSKTALEKPVIKAVMNSKFLPGQSAIGPVKTWLTIPFKIKTSK